MACGLASLVIPLVQRRNGGERAASRKAGRPRTIAIVRQRRFSRTVAEARGDSSVRVLEIARALHATPPVSSVASAATARVKRSRSSGARSRISSCASACGVDRRYLARGVRLESRAKPANATLGALGDRACRARGRPRRLRQRHASRWRRRPARRAPRRAPGRSRPRPRTLADEGVAIDSFRLCTTKRKVALRLRGEPAPPLVLRCKLHPRPGVPGAA